MIKKIRKDDYELQMDRYREYLKKMEERKKIEDELEDRKILSSIKKVDRDIINSALIYCKNINELSKIICLQKGDDNFILKSRITNNLYRAYKGKKRLGSELHNLLNNYIKFSNIMDQNFGKID